MQKKMKASMQLFRVLSMIQDKMKSQKFNALLQIREAANPNASSGSQDKLHSSGFSQQYQDFMASKARRGEHRFSEAQTAVSNTTRR
jgi:hypothetical protein